ncbi:WbbJ Acetyltransferase (isoleucine patch superfamily) [Methylophilaceae bacterium]
MADIRSLLRNWLSPGTTTRWIVAGFYRNPFCFMLTLLRSLWATRKLVGYFTPLKVRLGVGQKLSIKRNRKTKVVLEGVLSITSWGGSRLDSSISLAEGSSLKILGNFTIGPGVHISVSKHAHLKIRGQAASTGSGITCDSRIMAKSLIEIGADCIIAWDVFISDSDWHEIDGEASCAPIFIGDNVWIAHGASILKGAQVPSGCIIGAKSLVGRGEFQENSLIAGVPASVKRTGVEWAR